MRKQLETTAARRPSPHGWSLTQEILHRVQRSFDRERDERRDPAARALCYLLAEVIAMVGAGVPDREWRSDLFAFRSVIQGFAHILDSLEPTGELLTPEDGPFTGWSPEKTGMTIASLLLMQMGLREPEAGRLTMSDELDPDFKFGMSDAKRALTPKWEQKP